MSASVVDGSCVWKPDSDMAAGAHQIEVVQGVVPSMPLSGGGAGHQ